MHDGRVYARAVVCVNDKRTSSRVEGISKKIEYGPDHVHEAKEAHESAPHVSHKNKEAKAGRGRGEDKVIHKLETQMAASINNLNTKISQLDAPAPSSASRTAIGFGAMAALLAAVMQLVL